MKFVQITKNYALNNKISKYQFSKNRLAPYRKPKQLWSGYQRQHFRFIISNLKPTQQKRKWILFPNLSMI